MGIVAVGMSWEMLLGGRFIHLEELLVHLSEEFLQVSELLSHPPE